jgi:hypothetical protein
LPCGPYSINGEHGAKKQRWFLFEAYAFEILRIFRSVWVECKLGNLGLIIEQASSLDSGTLDVNAGSVGRENVVETASCSRQ